MPFELTILGSSSAIPTAKRYPTAQVLNVLGRFFLIDCGEGTQIQLRKQKIGFNRINHIFISHLHGDHFYGLIGLLSTINLMAYRQDVHIYAHADLEKVLQPQLNMMKGEMTYKIIFHHLNFNRKELIYKDKKVEVFSFPLTHSVPTCGFLFKEHPKQRNIKKELIIRYNISIPQIKAIKEGKDLILEDGSVIHNRKLTTPPPAPRSYAFCSDTRYNESIIETIKDVDLLYHEATFGEDLQKMAKKTLHSTAKEAATIAKKAAAKQLIIGHFSARYADITPLLKEAQAIFKNTIPAIDGTQYTVNRQNKKR